MGKSKKWGHPIHIWGLPGGTCNKNEHDRETLTLLELIRCGQVNDQQDKAPKTYKNLVQVGVLAGFDHSFRGFSSQDAFSKLGRLRNTLQADFGLSFIVQPKVTLAASWHGGTVQLVLVTNVHVRLLTAAVETRKRSPHVITLLHEKSHPIFWLILDRHSGKLLGHFCQGVCFRSIFL